MSPPPATPPPGGPYATPATGAGAAPSTRPTGVTILAVLAAIGAFFALMAALGSFMGGAVLGAGGAEGVGAFVAVLGVFLLIYAVAAAAVAYGLLKRARWAWYVTIVLVGLGLLGALVSLFSFDILSFLFQAAINGFVLWYLMKPEVQAWFGVRHNTPWKYKTAGTV